MYAMDSDGVDFADREEPAAAASLQNRETAGSFRSKKLNFQSLYCSTKKLFQALLDGPFAYGNGKLVV